MRKEAKIALESTVVILLLLFLFTIMFFSISISATSSGSSGNANLTIYDEIESVGAHYTFCSAYCESKTKGSAQAHLQMIYFYANYTNSTNSVINSTNGGNVTIRFNITGPWTDWENMTYNSTSLLWQFNRTVTYKGILNFSINATSNFGNVTISDPFTITNTEPYILKTSQGYIDFDFNGVKNILSCTEDTLCTYNFSANVSEDDLNDVLTYNYSTAANTTLANFTLNTTTGILTINITHSNNTGQKTVELNVRDTESTTISAILDVNITEFNDGPQFLNLGGNRTLNKSTFELILQASDEENDLNLTFNVTFMQCAFTSLNPPTGANNCTLFNITHYNATSGNISFTPAGNQKGEYKINFSVKDFRNATYSQVVNWTLTWNDKPYFTYICDNERNTTENNLFNCYINASDPDELNNLTFTANYTWLKFNSTQTNSTTINTTGGNASAIFNFTTSDAEVGNWSVNISIRDTGATNASAEINSTTFYFYVANVNDTTTIDDIANLTVYTSNNLTLIYANATDDDLLIPDKNVYNETLTFASNVTNVTINATSFISGTNKTQVTIRFNPNDLGLGNHSVNISVRDRNNFSFASDIFMIQVLGNNPPVWNASTQTNHTLTENIEFYLNLTQNVTDDGGSINFTFSNDTAFSSFRLNSTTGVINFTPIDVDIGQHIITINATDGITPSSLIFNFTVLNVNDTPVIQTPFPADLSGGVSYNATGNSTIGQINVTEDTNVRLTLWVHDDDFRIPSNQKSFYNENLTINLTIQGPNITLFRFTVGDNWFSVIPQRVEYDGDFTPSENDVGNYNITINVTDNSSLSHSISFNLTVLRVNDAPVLTDLGNIVSSVVESIYIDYNATDEEDKNESAPGSNITFTLTNLTAGGDFLTINRTTGIINFTFNQTYAGFWRYNVSVNDTSGKVDYELINVTVYDYPKINSPASSNQFNLVENVSYQFNFSVNHTVGTILNDTLNYTLIINGFIRNSTNGNGNGTAYLWNFTANFTDETTCSGVVNLTLNVSNAKLSNSTSWNLTINHTNYPLEFYNDLDDISGGSPSTITLSSYFRDIDASDTCRNQTIGFVANLLSGSGITTSITNWTNAGTPSAQFSASSDSSANYSLTAFEYNGTNYSFAILRNSTSNNFSVALTITTTTVSTPSSGGGGGGSSVVQKPISLNIIVPEPVSAKRRDKLIIPLGIVNDGQIDLNDIVLSSLVAKDGLLRSDLIASFDRSFIKFLPAGARENVTMIVDIDTSATGIFEVTINGTVRDPVYADTAKFYIEIEEEDDIIERIIFTEELIVGNPECAELKELVDSARDLYESNDLIAADLKIEEALQACRNAIEQPVSKRVSRNIQENLFAYISIASIVALGAGFIYYEFRKIKLKGQIVGFTSSINQQGQFYQGRAG